MNKHFESYIDALKDAIENDKVKDFIKGVNGYNVINNDLLNYGPLPEAGKDNYYALVLISGFKLLYTQTKDERISDILINTLLEMSNSEDLFDLYSTFMMLKEIVQAKLYKSMNFELKDINLIKENLKAKIEEKSNVLKQQIAPNSNLNLYEEFKWYDSYIEKTENFKLL